LLTFGDRCVRKFGWYRGAMVKVTYIFEVDRNFCGWAVFGTTNAASIEALPFPLSGCILLYSFPPLSFAFLATLRVDFFKVLSFQYLNLRNGYFRSLTYSVCVAEVTQVNSISVSPIHAPGFPGS
jgi:hypothetical protein